MLGRTLGDSIRAVRIARSVRRLTADPQAAVAEVALDARYFDQSHFSRVFRRVVGVTPQGFRELGRGERRSLKMLKSS